MIAYASKWHEEYGMRYANLDSGLAMVMFSQKSEVLAL
jgi:hypothetical protein